MGKIIVFMNEKGGLGKTSLVFNACHVLSGNKKKKRVLAIDMDAQMANLTYFTGTEKREDLPTMYNSKREVRPDSCHRQCGQYQQLRQGVQNA